MPRLASQTANPSHTYAEPGTYSVQLTVTTAAGSQTTTRTGYVTVRPVPSFSASVTTGGAPQTITFTDTTDVGSLTVTGRLWNFGDGTTSESTNPIHAYNTPGNYDVTLTLTTAQGAVQTLRDDYIQISPTVAYTVDTATGAAPLTVQFTDATNAGSLTISGYSWDFGDGTDPSTDTNPSHTYAAAGTYDVSLTVTTEQGNTNLTDEDAITVTAKSLPLAAGADGAFPVLLLDTTGKGAGSYEATVDLATAGLHRLERPVFENAAADIVEVEYGAVGDIDQRRGAAVTIGVSVQLIARIPECLRPGIRDFQGCHPLPLVAIHISRVGILGQAGVDSAVHHQFEMTIKHHTLTVVRRPTFHLGQCLCGRQATSDEIGDNRG